MNGRFSFTPTQADLLTAFKLHYPAVPRKRFGYFLLFAAFVGFAVAQMPGGVRAPETLAMMAGMTLFGAIVFLVIQAIVRLWWMPRYVRRIFAQQAELRHPTHVSWDENGFHATSESGEFRQQWKDFYRWKRNDSMILLYRSEALFNFISLESDEGKAAADAIQAHLINAGVETL